MYEKTLLLTQDKRLEQSIRLLLRTKKKEVEKDLPLLSDIDSIRRDISQFKNTLHLRREFSTYVKSFGFPFMIIMDYIIDFGLPKEMDPDKRKLFRTFLIAFTILAKGKGYDSARTNIVLITDPRLEANVAGIKAEPAIFLQKLKTQDERVNEIIESFSRENTRVKEYFNFGYILRPEGGDYNRVIENLETIVDTIDCYIQAEERTQRTAGMTEMITDDIEAASVICRATEEMIVVNGIPHKVTKKEREQYRKKNINLIGAITSRTTKTVGERIISTFSAVNRISPFKKDEKIFINVLDSSVIDGSFASSMGSLLGGELAPYTGISLQVGTENCRRLQRSPGFIAVRDFLIKNL
ncbi:MAG: hypothetical protein JXQ30_17075 [Spirochaetes bacterium]|nr:hypothetical protein [Spirochaetota bacterium]